MEFPLLFGSLKCQLLINNHCNLLLHMPLDQPDRAFCQFSQRLWKNNLHRHHRSNSLITVPLKGKLTVSTRSSKLDSRVAKVETFEFRDARIEARESRVENRESRKMDFGICINSRRTRESDLCLEEMNNSAYGAFVRNIHVDSKQAFNVLGPRKKLLLSSLFFGM